jgi:hypothetical protein
VAPIEVQVRICIKRLFDLNTQDQTFGVCLALTLMWKLPDARERVIDGSFQPTWVPVYRIMNIMDEISEPDPQYSVVEENGEYSLGR